MIRGIEIREAGSDDRAEIGRLLTAAFKGDAEAKLAEDLVRAGDAVLELVAIHDQGMAGHLLFSRLQIQEDGSRLPVVALAPVAVTPALQGTGIGTTLIEHGHAMLQQAGERLCVVLGDPAYYRRFGYEHDRAADFASDYQSPALQAIAWGDAPSSGRLVYPAAFTGL